ncbi:MAG: trypsin-like peptidase domain-containing protein [Fimbriimonas sp.]
MKPVRSPKTAYWILAAGFVLGAMSLATLQSGVAIQKAFANSPTSARALPINGLTAENVATLRTLNESFANLSEFAKPAVVHIRSESGRVVTSNGQRMPQVGGQGSGFIFRPDGYIVTNDHVVGGYDRVTVILADGRELPGKVIRAEDSDIAVVKVEGKDLPTLQFADSSTVRVGQFSLAIGSPFGLENSVTVGHVSAIGRQDLIQDRSNPNTVRMYPDLIQTDASINMGNSGGPLINVDGQVIGINTAIFSATGGSVGIGFAIPANQARLIANKLITDGKLTRSMIGLVPVDLKPFQKKELGVEGGALVESVQSDGPAEAAGLKQGDIITKVAQTEVKNQLDLRNAMLEYRPGTEVTIDYLRAGKPGSTKVKLKEYSRPKVPTVAPGNGGSPLDELPFDLFKDSPPSKNGDPGDGTDEKPLRAGPVRLGVMVESVSPALKTQFNLPDNAAGAVVVTVQPGSVADRLGLKAGDLIERFDKQVIAKAQDLTDLMKGVKLGDRKSIAYRRFDKGSEVRVETDVAFR